MRSYKVSALYSTVTGSEEREAILYAFDYNDAVQMAEQSLKDNHWICYRNITPNFEEPTVTLRDQFAIGALNATRTIYSNFGFPEHAQEMAKQVYQIADAMLAEREKK